MSIRFETKGSFDNTFKYLRFLKEFKVDQILNKYGELGVSALSSSTPVRTGLTASSWSYEVERNSDQATISFYNSNVNKNVNIAIILQYGHGTGTGGWVQGYDYINPAIQPVFDELVENVWGEITKV